MSLGKKAFASAPCSLTLLGYDLHDHIGTSVGIALDKRIKCETMISESFMVNNDVYDGNKYPYVRAALLHGWSDIDTPVSFEIDDITIPDNVSGYGPGHIASTLGSLSMMNDNLMFEDILLKGHEILKENDSKMGVLGLSTAINGYGTVLSNEIGKGHLWSVGKGKKARHIHHLDMPDMTFVLAFQKGGSGKEDFSGKFNNFARRQSGFFKDMLKDSAKLAKKGLQALERGDMEGLGQAMNETDKLTKTMGMYTPELKVVADLCRSQAFGARLCISEKHAYVVTLTNEPEELASNIREKGHIAMVAGISRDGLQI